MITNFPFSPAARITDPIQSLGFGVLGSFIDAIVLVINCASGTRSRSRSTCVSFSHMYPSSTDVGLAIFSATLHSTVDTDNVRPEWISRRRTISSPFSERGAAVTPPPSIPLASI